MKGTVRMTGLVLFALVCVSAAAEPERVEKSVRLSLPGQPWVLVIDLPGFTVDVNDIQPEQGGRLYFFASNDKTKVNFSVSLQPLGEPANLDECRTFLQEKSEKRDFVKREVKLSETQSAVHLEYLVPEAQGYPLRQKNLLVCMPKDNVYLDFHFSKVLFEPGQERLFTSILETVRFETTADLAAGEGEPGAERDSARWYLEAAKAWVKLGLVEEAIGGYQMAIRRDPNLIEAHLQLGAIYLAQGKLAEARREFEEVIRQQPMNPTAHFGLGGVLFQSGREAQLSSEARQHFEVFLKQAPRSPETAPLRAVAYFQLGVIQALSGHEKEALELYEGGLNENPEDTELLNNAAWLYATAKDQQLRNPEKALAYALEAVQRSPKQRAPAYLDTLAEVYFVTGNIDKAIETEKKALTVSPDCAPCKEQLKKFEQAKQKP